MKFRTIRFDQKTLYLLDQKKLPFFVEYKECHDVHDVWMAISQLVVRGAPAIGVAAAYGVVLSTVKNATLDNVLASIKYLRKSRPTAVNLFHALDRMGEVAIKSPTDLHEALLAEADLIYVEEAESAKKIGQYGKDLIKNGMKILTHCNAGALATVEHGTALAPLYAAHDAGVKFEVYADETRPLFQGRLTAWELNEAEIPVTVICDSMAASVIREKKIDLIIVGADRIVANGDVANKIGTYGVAIAAHYHKVPFYVAAPLSTFDKSLETGKSIPIEERSGDELKHVQGTAIIPVRFKTFNPAFDVTPNELITGYITDKGLFSHVASIR